MAKIYKKSISSGVILKMAMRISIVIMLVSSVTYFHLMSELESGLKEQLQLYTKERVQIEGQWFDFIDYKLQDLRTEFLKRYRALNGVEPKGQFNKWFKMNDDGTAFTRKEFYEGTPGPIGSTYSGLSGGIDNTFPLTTERRISLIIAMEMLTEVGPSIVRHATGYAPELSPFINLYFFTPQKDVVNYWPGTPWFQDFKGGFDLATQGDFTKTTNTKLPWGQRDRLWSNTYVDEVPKITMVSFTVPIDLNGQCIAAIGSDISLNNLNQRLSRDTFSGAKNFIVRKDGTLIAAPSMQEELTKAGGQINVLKDGVQSLKDAVNLVLASSDKTIFDDSENKQIISASKIPGPGWFFITIYPKSMMTSSAIKTVNIILIISLFSICIEIIMIWLVLKKQVVTPLNQFTDATEGISRGDLSPAIIANLPVNRHDEIGALAHSFSSMTYALLDHRNHLEEMIADRTRDLTLANEKLSDQKMQLELINSELESFSYSVSHDLRAPLRGIKGWSLALAEDYGPKLDEKAKSYITRISTETRRMEILIENLLKLSQISRTEMKSETVHLTKIVQTIASRLADERPDRRINFIIQPDLVNRGDHHFLEIVLDNLLRNSHKFTGKCFPPEIEFGATLIEGQMTYFVRDNGAGFDMEFAKKLFTPFQRMHNSSEYPGTGIGLAIVKRIISLHHGKIWAEASVNNGSTFYFTLNESPKQDQTRQEQA